MNEDIEHSLRQSINTNRSDRNNSVRKSVTGKQTVVSETKSIEESPSINPVRLNSGNREFKANESTVSPSKETSRINLDTKRSTLTQREMINVQSQERAIESEETSLRKIQSVVTEKGPVSPTEVNKSKRLNSMRNS